MASDFQPIIDWLNANPDWVLFSLGFSAFLESLALVGIIVPGVAILFVIAAIAGNTGISLTDALMAGFFGAVLGDILSFYIGRGFKNHIEHTWPFTRFPNALKAGEEFFKKHGGKSVVIGRFVGPIRPVLPLIAGAMDMSQIKFICINIASAIAWSPLYILPGYISGSALQTDIPDNLATFVVSLLFALAIAALLFRVASQRLQSGSDLYTYIELKKQHSPLIRRLWSFLSADQTEASEFPLASISLTIFASFFFWCWTLIHLNTSWLLGMDQAVLALATFLRHDASDAVLVSLTLIGNEAFLYISFILLVGLLIWKKQFWAATHITAGGLLTAATTHGLKAWFAIPRPDLVAMPPSSFAYPSGHSSGAVIFWGLLASLIAQDLSPGKRWQVYLALFIPMLLIAFSRVFLGVHWLSDIVAGIVLGLALCGLTRLSYSRFNTSKLNLLTENRNELRLFFGLWIVSAVIYQTIYFSDTLEQFRIISS